MENNAVTSLFASFDKISALADDFDEHKESYLKPAYSEMQLRTDFVDKMITHLGWDVAHIHQKNPFQQEVKVERVQADGPAKRRADYALFVGPNFSDPRLFIEAKKPLGELATKDNYFQAVRYGWNNQNPFVLLTNFRETHLLDCRAKPDLDTILKRQVKKFDLDDLRDLDRFTELFFLLSREAVGAGALEEFAATLPRPRGPAVQRGLFKGGYQLLDRTFLAELESHREALAASLYANNASLNGYELTEITQRVLDRLIFIRFLEDKLIEPNYIVSTFGGRGSAWDDFVNESRRLDTVYNGVVFKKHNLIDTGKLQIDDTVFSEICEQLSHYNSPYDFNFIPIQLLGSIYERFLGKVVCVSRNRARIEDKPEVRKAGGVYYTPEYVVQHLVRETVTARRAGRSPAQMAKLKVCDLSCGPHRVFEEAAVDTSLFVLQRETDARIRDRTRIRIVTCRIEDTAFVFSKIAEIPQKAFLHSRASIFDTSISPETDAVKNKMRRGIQIGVVFDVKFGMKTGDDAKFLHRRAAIGPKDKPVLRGEDVQRYSIRWNGEYVRYDPVKMRAHRGTARPGEAARFEQPKVLVKDTSKILGSAYDDGNHYVKDVLIVAPRSGEKPSYNLKFVSAVLNSQAMTFFYRTTYNTIHVQSGELSSLPLPRLDRDNERHVQIENEVAAAYSAIFEVLNHQRTAMSDHELEFNERRKGSLEKRIETLVSEAYGLTVAEQRLIEAVVADLG